MSILIKDTTKEERAKIVEESIGNIAGACDGCSVGIVEMYQDYIDGKKEIFHQGEMFIINSHSVHQFNFPEFTHLYTYLLSVDVFKEFQIQSYFCSKILLVLQPDGCDDP